MSTCKHRGMAEEAKAYTIWVGEGGQQQFVGEIVKTMA
jgi:hypothetical protein